MARRLLHYILSTESTAQSGSQNPKSTAKAAKTAPKAAQRPPGESKPSMGPEPRLRTPKTSPSIASVAHSVEPPAAERDPQIAKQAPSVMDEESVRLITNALQIISEESGIAIEDLGDDSVLSDVGIDSLLGLMISSRFRDELAVDIDSTVLHGLATIKGLKDFLGPTRSDPTDRDATETASVPKSDGNEDHGNQSELPPASHTLNRIEPKPKSQSDPSVKFDTKKISSNVEGPFTEVLQIISEETGIAIDDFADDTVFVDAGVDSLLSLMISSRLRDELDLEISSDGEMFTTCPTVGDLRTWLASSGSTSADDTPAEELETESVVANSSFINTDSSVVNSSNGTFSHNNNSDSSDTSSDENYVEVPKPSIPSRRATSVILQGRPWMSSKTLFLFPDGAGSATSYANLPRFTSNIAVIGLNCPYVRHPQEMTGPLDELVRSYLDEVRRRQPHGPYNFGGWSAGGVLAYRAIQILVQEGEEVENLILIDSPEPKGMDRLPQRFYDHCNRIGIFGKAMPGPSTSPPAHLIAHFNATIEVLHNYHAKPLAIGSLRRVTIIWATDSVMDGIKLPKLPPGPDDTEGMKFLTEKRTDFTAGGWKDLFPGVEVDAKSIQGAHHFSMMVSFNIASMLSGTSTDKHI